MIDEERLERQFAFIREIDREKFIIRQTYLTGAKRQENDAEHAWHLAVMALLLGGYANEKIDLLKTVSMVLIHDLVEIDAGDTYAYAGVSHEAQHEKEAKGADRIFGLLPPDQGQAFRALWEEFEEGETPEAKFAHTLDNLQPMMQNDMTGGQMWQERGIALSQVLRRNARTADGSAVLWDYAKSRFLVPHVGKELKADTELPAAAEAPAGTDGAK